MGKKVIGRAKKICPAATRFSFVELQNKLSIEKKMSNPVVFFGMSPPSHCRQPSNELCFATSEFLLCRHVALNRKTSTKMPIVFFFFFFFFFPSNPLACTPSPLNYSPMSNYPQRKLISSHNLYTSTTHFDTYFYFSSLFFLLIIKQI